MKAMFTHSQMTTSVVAARVARRRINQPTRSHNMQSTFWRTTVAALGTVLASHCALAEKVCLVADQNSGILNQPIYSEPPPGVLLGDLAYTNFSDRTHVCNFYAPFWIGNCDVGGMMLAKFDLSAYEGYAAVGNGYFSNGIVWAVAGGYYGVYPLLSNWIAGTVTWNNYIGAVSNGTWRNVCGPKMSQIGPTLADNWMQKPPYAWVVSQSVIQAWLDGSMPNNGLAIMPLPASELPPGAELNQCFGTVNLNWDNPENDPKKFRPQLVIDVVIPEPASGVVLAGLLLVARRRR
jgi:hypothetical protein